MFRMFDVLLRAPHVPQNSGDARVMGVKPRAWRWAKGVIMLYGKYSQQSFQQLNKYDNKYCSKLNL